MHCKGCIFTVVLLAVFRHVECRHFLDHGMATGRMVHMQDRVIESCRGHFMCEPFPYRRSLGLTCVHANSVCDGIKDCKHGEDEDQQECQHKGHKGGGMVLYDSHASDHAGDFPLDHGDRAYDVLDEYKGDGEEGQKTAGSSSKKEPPKNHKTQSSRPHVIVIQQPAAKVAHAPPPKKHRPIMPKHRPIVPMPFPVRPPIIPQPIGLPPPIMGGGLGLLGGLGIGGLAELLD
ncbi:uncharacterized protein LOC123554719 [Mercenaria mercenaria]|uniref:uncharacterized protein LOC123554719 n=1 Tax=Mercenaria mercenaria TaxID=6596 RepID=UPI00234E956D|nr:uncharacterized protein LOC123554719 [Mercenaria mercenaria]